MQARWIWGGYGVEVRWKRSGYGSEVRWMWAVSPPIPFWGCRGATLCHAPINCMHTPAFDYMHTTRVCSRGVVTKVGIVDCAREL